MVASSRLLGAVMVASAVMVVPVAGMGSDFGKLILVLQVASPISKPR